MDVGTTTAVRMSLAGHSEVLTTSKPSKTARKRNRRKKNKADQDKEQGAKSGGVDMMEGAEHVEEETGEEQVDSTSTPAPPLGETSPQDRPLPDPPSSPASSASTRVHTDTPPPTQTPSSTAFFNTVRRTTPPLLVSELFRADRQLEAEIGYLQARIKLGRELQMMLRRLSKMKEGDDEEELWRIANVMRARWQAGL
ncbi:hypothetical protein PMZ80_004336 [Knufia obscura]|uniref:Uncharacterized protein n=1 Tax=Knufia obscura TaxID=1635080 RepID=A0ABR0RTF2_9EURO|nr:hypothetical protein PMZ80_004336 [Knufia obscura]